MLEERHILVAASLPMVVVTGSLDFVVVSLTTRTVLAHQRHRVSFPPGRYHGDAIVVFAVLINMNVRSTCDDVNILLMLIHEDVQLLPVYCRSLLFL